MQEWCYEGKKALGENGLHVFCQQQNYVKYKAVLRASCYAREVYSSWKTSTNSISEICIQITIFQWASEKKFAFFEVPPF